MGQGKNKTRKTKMVEGVVFIWLLFWVVLVNAIATTSDKDKWRLSSHWPFFTPYFDGMILRDVL